MKFTVSWLLDHLKGRPIAAQCESRHLIVTLADGRVRNAISAATGV
jgi:hypothetical protein